MSPFLIIPAIDLMSGHCVRLRQGRADDVTEFSGDPAEVARSFEAAGAKRIHVIDLDGAFGGAPENLEAIRAIRRAVGCQIELGGGLRNTEAVAAALAEGIDFVILGTLAVERPKVLGEIVQAHGERILVAIDARDGIVAARGWVAFKGNPPAEEFARHMVSLGVRTFLHTDISRNGMMVGPNLDATRALAQAVEASFIASGGVASMDDLHAVADMKVPNLIGAIVGRALYDGRIDLAETIRLIQRS